PEIVPAEKSKRHREQPPVAREPIPVDALLSRRIDRTCSRVKPQPRHEPDQSDETRAKEQAAPSELREQPDVDRRADRETDFGAEIERAGRQRSFLSSK